ncbi:MAG TPA: ABC transporter substrate-binding protein [Anaerolineales bacterium]|nr:ABC transporter substrate-binding protein [Anaerolineales bacterium]
MKSKSLWLFISLLVVSSMLLASCGSNASSSNGTYLTINFEQVPTWVRNFNPFSASPLGATLTAIYEPMMIYNKSTGKLVPWLATEYAWNSDNTLLTFKIRQNVKWSDGKPFTAQDVVYTFDLLKNNSALSGTGSNVLSQYVDSVTAPDDFTVEFKFKAVYTLAIYDLANQVIVPEHIWKDVKDPLTWTNDNPVATGPFTKVAKFDSQIYIMEKNPYYWQPGKPAFKGIRYPAFADNDAANLALANGELDWTGNFVPDIEKTFVAKDPAHNHYYFVGGGGIALLLNPSIKPFDNPDVRKAISLGIDRKMIVQTAEYNYIPPADATGLGDTQSIWKDPAAVAAGTWVNYDAAKANAMLDAAGLTRGSDGTRIGPDGKPMQYELIVPSGWTDWISACQIISQNMKDLGIIVNLTTPEENTWTDTVTKGQHQWALGWGSDGPTPYNFYRGEMSALTVQPVGQSSSENWNRYVNADADKLLEQFAKTADITQQKQIMDQIEMIFVNEAPVVPLFPGPDWYEFSTLRFTGFPDANNPYAPGIPYPGNPYETPLIVLTTITPVTTK